MITTVREDMELLTAWRSGDRSAGNTLFDHYFEAIRRFFAGKVSGAVEDLVQQTFLACVSARDRIQLDQGFRPYLFAIARSKLYDHLRQEYRRPTLDTEAISAVDLGITPSTALAIREHEQLTLKALCGIPIDLQIMLELYYFEDLSAPELAKIFEVPLGTVRSRVRRGLEQLRAEIERLTQSPSLREETGGTLAAWAAKLDADRRSPRDPSPAADRQ